MMFHHVLIGLANLGTGRGLDFQCKVCLYTIPKKGRARLV